MSSAGHPGPPAEELGSRDKNLAQRGLLTYTAQPGSLSEDALNLLVRQMRALSGMDAGAGLEVSPSRHTSVG